MRWRPRNNTKPKFVFERKDVEFWDERRSEAFICQACY